MVWGGFGYGGKTDLVMIEGHLNSDKYQKMLQGNLIASGSTICGDNWKFQQDNASIHTSKATMGWFKSNRVDVIEWPACSPDMNPIENLWGVLTYRVYGKNKQYESVNDLKMAIINAWESLKKEELQKLVDSMPDRVFQLIQSKGGATKY